MAPWGKLHTQNEPSLTIWDLGIWNLGMEFGIGRTHPAHAFTGRELRVEV